MKSDSNKNNTAGMSRAAKKRAKKKQKKQNSTKSISVGENMAGDNDDNNNNRKRPLDEDDKKATFLREKDLVKSEKKQKHVMTDENGKRVQFVGKHHDQSKKPKQQQQQQSKDDENQAEQKPKGILRQKKKKESQNQSADVESPPFLTEDIAKFLHSENLSLMDILLLTKKADKDSESEDEEDKEEEINKAEKSKNDDKDQGKEEGADEKFRLDDYYELTSKQRATCALQYLTKLPIQEFYETYWEKEPLCVQANSKSHRHRLDGFLSLKQIQELLQKKQHSMFYGRDLNVTQYRYDDKDGTKKRITLDPLTSSDKPISPKFIWSRFQNPKNSCTVRLLCPHKQNDRIHSLLSLLELEWGCMVGSNAYLTPENNSQGFAPHYDDIEAFCLQLEGRKRWKVYPPPTGHSLPRASSEDYTEEDLYGIKPVLDVVLEPGDLLYMPRGWIHQACTLPLNDSNNNNANDADKNGQKKNHNHSLHLTISTMQQWAWVDLLDLIIPEALDNVSKSENSTLRQGLPKCFLDYMGAMYDDIPEDELPEALKMQMQKFKNNVNDNNKEGDDNKMNTITDRKDCNDNGENMIQDEEEDEEKDGNDEVGENLQIQELHLRREKFREQAKKHILRVAKEAMEMVDAACDQMGKRFLSERQPPGFTAEEVACTAAANNSNNNDATTKIWPTTLCRLARPGIARLVLEENKAVVYHCGDNSRVYQEIPLSPMEYEMDDGPALEQLLRTCEPNWIMVGDLMHDAMEDKIAIAQSLYEEGILAIQNN